MVTVRNDIENAITSNGNAKEKEANFKPAQPAKFRTPERSFNCVAIVALTVLTLVIVLVGSVYFYERHLSIHQAFRNSNALVPTEAVPIIPPEVIDPFAEDRKNTEEVKVIIEIDPPFNGKIYTSSSSQDDDDDEDDDDELLTSSSSQDDDDEDDDDDDDHSGSGSGDYSRNDDW